MQAERAWAYAMDLKSQLEDEEVVAQVGCCGDLLRMAAVGGWVVGWAMVRRQVPCRCSTAIPACAVPCCAQKRQHLIRRLAKAALHAGELVALAAARCDARTQLEAEAYALWLAGSLLLEKESDWEGAAARFLKARCGRRACRRSVPAPSCRPAAAAAAAPLRRGRPCPALPCRAPTPAAPALSARPALQAAAGGAGQGRQL